MSSQTPDPPTAEIDLERFVSAQAPLHASALAELQRGRKESHWMWFIFPQLAGLGSSETARRFAIRSLDEARAYLMHPLLGPRLVECCRALLAIDGRSAFEILGSPDDLKLRSSMTLFSLVPESPQEFRGVLRRYYAGQPDERTLNLLQSGSGA